ncbi:hypothetical protein GCU60_10000 [Blastococcus saxobsidens]|uniref:Uncharacterized protein n=1 Tax=Blastococcus saxobsidens TaxID=138336 RepID=A0A6L9W276_9ACTN|nr:hypothetical protein [Blastococcus saxobsidens]NEK86088.1 hypothetical protein [Blastococcus saxobsidens]
MTAGQDDQHGQQQGPHGGQPDGPAWPSAPQGQQPGGQQQGQSPYGQPGPPPQGQPPYGWAPPGQQPPQAQNPYGQNPYGQPHGQNPYAFPSAPSAGPGWGPEPPTPMERPVTVRAGVGAFLASLVLSAVGGIVTFLNWDEMLEWTLAETPADAGVSQAEVEQFAELGLQFGVAFGVLLLLLQALFVWFAWRGRNWARIVLWVLGGLVLLSAPFNAVSSGPVPFVTALTWFQILLTLVGVVLLALKPSNDWYRFRKWQYATGQG